MEIATGFFMKYIYGFRILFLFILGNSFSSMVCVASLYGVNHITHI